MNKKVGIYSSVITLFGVIGFALSMLFGSMFLSYLSSMFISWGFVPLICSFTVHGSKETKAAGLTANSFAVVYAVLIMLVYFAQLTTVRITQLSNEAYVLLDYQKFGLFFNYDLLGYGFMALSTFFISFSVKVTSKSDKWLKRLLQIHGIFFIQCIVMPILGVFKPGMEGGDIIGIIALTFWCIYFTPVCILSFYYFRKQNPCD